MNFTDKEIDEMIKGVFDGEITKENLPENLYTAIAEFLQGGLYKGFGGSVADFGGTDLNLLQELRTNIYMFSAAKTYQEVRTMTDLMYEGDNLKPFKDFYEDARGLYDTYNKNYAETEYNTAVASAEMGAKWNEIVKDADLFPLLKMTVVEDAQTTEICEPLDGIVLPINDPFWDEFYPPNHWNCRSTVLQLDEGEVSSKAEVEKAKEHADEDMQDVFKMNVGKDEYVFSPEHPYFTSVPKEDREFAKENFGLPMPEDLSVIMPKNTKQAKEFIAGAISEFSGLNVAKVSISSELNIEQLGERYKTIKSLFQEYKVNPVISRENEIKVTLKSTKSAYGFIKHYGNGTITEINFGDKYANDKSRIFDPLFKGLRAKSRVDEKNLPIATTVHEFTHVLGIDSNIRSDKAPQWLKDFFTELKEVKNNYIEELLKYSRAGEMGLLNEYSLGKYASTNINEFMAEGFTEYKLSSTPSKYALKVGNLIDKYFKR
ncbi:Phage head morphogenesis domain [uncultured Caudovirales phage]|uniref:Phage head morphogenesis domain n=1 Tax=uncultured Caudovirales phage TaxID=2100421 RepID=A0A6J7W8Q7_9CAUD|nr:Phage head morphogenesis domain [uncultured Caudovirales phage]CAB5170755.1 Phage head morphogenesis domain [uncultured Caudovirales phage]